MKRILDIFKNARLGWIFAFTSIVLIITSFILPPTGMIDPSVLTAAGILFAFATLHKIPEIISSIREGQSVKLTSGDLSVEVSKDSDKE